MNGILFLTESNDVLSIYKFPIDLETNGITISWESTGKL